MGRTVRRFWDAASGTSRGVRADDEAGSLFDAFVPHPLAGWEPRFGETVWQALTEAQRALSQVQHVGAAMPAVDWIMTRSESSGSSLIEGVRASAREIAHAEAGGASGSAAGAEAIRNVAATRLALRLGAERRALRLGDINEIHAALMGDADDAGTLRHQQGWIGTALHQTPHDAIHVAAPVDLLAPLMDDLVQAANRPTASPLLQAALVHAQFITIHPYRDGNGRTGRCLMHLMLRRSGMTAVCAPPLSVALAGRRSRYLRALNMSRAVCDPADPARSSRLEPWLRLFCEAMSAASAYAVNAVEHLGACHDDWTDALRRGGVRSDNAAMRLLPLLVEHPVLTARTVADLLGVDDRTARRSLDRLVAVGALRQRGDAQRRRVFEAPAVLESFQRLAEPETDSADIATETRTETSARTQPSSTNPP